MAAGAFAWRVRRNEAEFRPVTLSELFVEDAWFVGGTRPAGTPLRARGAGASAASGGSGSRASVLSAPDGKESDDAASVGVDGKVGTVRGRLRSSGRTSEAASPAKRPAVDPAAAAAAAATVVSASATPSGYNAAAAAASDTDGVPVQTWDAHCSRCRDPLSAPPIPVRMAADEAAEQAYVAKFRVTADQLQMVVAAIQRRPGISPKEIFHTLRLMLPATKGITAEQYPALFAAFMSGVAKPQRWKLTHALCACVINPWRLHVLTGAECYFDGRYGRLHVFGGSPFHSGLKLDAPVIGLVYAID